MYQVRYFLAVARMRNFTRAAEECDVAQPSLSRAIKQLEAELGGELFRRERPQASLTELGERMLPILRQCYDSAGSARAIAAAASRGEVGALRLSLSHSVGFDLVARYLDEVRRVFDKLQLVLLRGSFEEAIEHLENGEVELAVAA